MDFLSALQDAQNQKLKRSVWYHEANDYISSCACWTPDLDLSQNIITLRNRYHLHVYSSSDLQQT